MKYVLVLVLALGAGIFWRFSKQAEAREHAATPPAPLAVRVVNPVPAAKVQKVSFPGTVRPVDQVTLYARSNGFVRGLVVDLGDRVKKGQVLAQLDAPDLAASLAQARARLEQAKASIVLVRAQHERTKALAANGNLSPQDVDTSSLKVTTSESDLASTSAEVDRLGALVSYLTVRAPFDGTVTRRYLDDGALVSQERTALFDLASTTNLQIDVDVPQWGAGQIAVGATAEISTNGKVAPATVTRTAGALDPVLRTLKTELKADGGEPLVPGSYVRVTFSIPREDPPLVVAGSALSIRSGALEVVTVDAQLKVHLVPVKIARELGRDVELSGELTPASRVVLYPPASLQEGDTVTLATDAPRAL
jgi:membrane fusion protein, multidrug efflux system